jgi:copper chaperone CopZ
MKTKLVALIIFIALGGAVLAASVFMGGETVAQAAAMTELNIQNLSCGSCVKNIQQALAQVDGVDKVEVSVTNSRGRVTFDPARTNSSAIAKLVTEAGYSASVRLDLSQAEFQKLQNEQDQFSAAYVARIGSRLLAREDFNQALQLRMPTDLGGNSAAHLSPQLQAQVWQELKEREILLAAAETHQIVVQDGEVQHEIERLEAANPDFAKTIPVRFGSAERFFIRMKENMVINRNLEQHVFEGAKTERDKQLRFAQWYQDTLQNTEVVIFDPGLKQVESTGNSGCGGSCCGKNS